MQRTKQVYVKSLQAKTTSLAFIEINIPGIFIRNVDNVLFWLQIGFPPSGYNGQPETHQEPRRILKDPGKENIYADLKNAEAPSKVHVGDHCLKCIDSLPQCS